MKKVVFHRSCVHLHAGTVDEMARVLDLYHDLRDSDVSWDSLVGQQAQKDFSLDKTAVATFDRIRRHVLSRVNP